VTVGRNVISASSLLQPLAAKRVLGYLLGTKTTKFFASRFPMPKIALTDRFCSSAKAFVPQTDYFDTTVQGLALRVTDRGNRSWCFHYRSPRDGKRARLTIGTYPATSLAVARGKAVEAKGHVDAGQDPRLVLAGQASAGMTVAALANVYLADPEKMALRSRDEIARRLRKNVVPIIGEVKLAELRRRDVRNVSDTILKRGRRTEATRVFEDVRAMVRWAVENEYSTRIHSTAWASPPNRSRGTASLAMRKSALYGPDYRRRWHGRCNAKGSSSFAS
jgi:hypothetical protein